MKTRPENNKQEHTFGDTILLCNKMSKLFVKKESDYQIIAIKDIMIVFAN